jgi:hypothetical protein
MEIEDLDEVLKDIGYSKVGFMVDMNTSSQNYSLYTYNANKKT